MLAAKELLPLAEKKCKTKKNDLSIQCARSIHHLKHSVTIYWQWSTSSSQVFMTGFPKKAFVPFIVYIKSQVFMTHTVLVSDVLQFMLKYLVGYVCVCAVNHYF